MVQYYLTHATSMWKKLCVATRLTFARARHRIGIFPIPRFSRSFFLSTWNVVSLLLNSGSADALQFHCSVITGADVYTALYAVAVLVHVGEKRRIVGWKTRTGSHIDRVPLKNKHSNPFPMALKFLSMRSNCDDDNTKFL